MLLLAYRHTSFVLTLPGEACQLASNVVDLFPALIGIVCDWVLLAM